MLRHLGEQRSTLPANSPANPPENSAGPRGPRHRAHANPSASPTNTKKATCLGGVIALVVALSLGQGATAAPVDLEELPRTADGAVDFSGPEWTALAPSTGDLLMTDRFTRNGVPYRLDVRAPWSGSSLGWGANPLFANTITNERDGDSHTYSYSGGDARTSTFVLATASGLRGFRCDTGRPYYTGVLQGSPVAARECEDRQSAGSNLKVSDVLRATPDGRVVHDVTLTNVGAVQVTGLGFGAWLDTELDGDDSVPLIKSTQNALYMENASFRLYLAMTGGDTVLAGAWRYHTGSFAAFADVSDFAAGDVIVTGLDSTVAFLATDRTLAPGQSLTMSYEERVFSVAELQPGRAIVRLIDDDGSGAPVSPTDPAAAQLTGEPLTEIGFTLDDAVGLAPAGYVVSSIDNITLYDDNNSTVQQIVVHLAHAVSVATVTQTRTIAYAGAGALTPPAVVQTQDFRAETDQITGVTTYANGTGLAAVPNPTVPGYRALGPDVAAVAPNAPATTTRPADIAITVQYVADQLQAVIAVDGVPAVSGAIGGGAEGGQVTLDGSESFDPGGGALSFAWDLTGNGAYDDGDQAGAILSLPVAGTYRVGLQVTDGEGRTAITVVDVLVSNVVPVVEIGASAEIRADGAFARAGSFIDPGADTWTGVVIYGDGSGAEALTLDGKAFSLNHSYAEPGQYTVTVRIADTAGGSTGQAAIEVTVPSASVPSRSPTPTPTSSGAAAPPPPSASSSTSVPATSGSTAASGASAPPELPFTGADVTVPATASGLLMAAGLVALAVRRARSRT
ncbi:MAG: hypothetical protein LBK95_19285 [Bifidobacteriaceae bacterium]|jgi:hypothetical protein|nr:hypothetical protein [Bifidobacteriaceae bacterium]